MAVIWRCWFWTMNLNLSQAMAMMQKDDMKIGKSCPAFTNLHRYSVKGCDQWMAEVGIISLEKASLVISYKVRLVYFFDRHVLKLRWNVLQKERQDQNDWQRIRIRMHLRNFGLEEKCSKTSNYR